MKTEVIIIDSKAYAQLKAELQEIIISSVHAAMQRILDDRGLDPDWVKKDPAMNLLGIKSKSKLQNLRDAGEIVFSQRANSKTIMYSRLSILEYLEKNKHPNEKNRKRY